MRTLVLVGILFAFLALLFGFLAGVGVYDTLAGAANNIVNPWAGKTILFVICLVPAVIFARWSVVVFRRASAGRRRVSDSLG